MKPRRILQFGTSRFLQAHVDLFAHEANAVGRDAIEITVTKISPDSSRAHRVGALAVPGGFRVELRGLHGGSVVERTVQVRSVKRALTAETEWPRLVDIFAEDTDLVVSNSGDEGYRLSERDGEVAGDGLRAPVSFPAKLASLLIARWRRTARGLSIFPCELVNRNGDALRAVVEEAAIRCGAPPAFRKWLSSDVRFVNTLVDRIVSEPIEPAGAVAEPYALWAIEGMQAGDAPFEHLAVVVTPDLERYERLKLHILNLGHTVLADRWLAGGAAAMTVGEAVADPAYRAYLDLVFEQEVLPGFAARGLEVEARDYMRTTMERFANPFLKHRLADIAQNHSMKVVRRIGGFRDWATSAGHAVEMRRLDEICERSASRR